MKKLTASMLLVVFVFGLFPFQAFAQNGIDPLPGSIKGFDRSVFDYHFGRADREINPERWLSEAMEGTRLALYAWESLSFGMFETGVEMDEARKQIEKWSEAELELRFTRWLTRRFFGAEFEDSTGKLSAAVSDLHLSYTDRHIWRNESRQSIEALLENFEVSVLYRYPELLAFIPEEMRENLGNVIAKASDNVNSAIKIEFENIAAREERLFTGRKTGYSFLKNREDEQASNITANLIEQAQAVCNAGIESLETQIRKAENGEGDLVLMGTEWLEMYREQFDRGLKIWEEAEKRFFLSRIEWEQDALRRYEEGEEAWVLAFNKLENERQKWEFQVKELFNSGEQLFIKASEALEFAIREAKAEFEKNMPVRVEAAVSKAMAYVDIFFTYATAYHAEKEYALYWLKQYDADSTIDINDDAVFEWIKIRIIRELFSPRKRNYLRELEKSIKASRSFYENAVEIQELIINDFGDIFGTGVLKDVLGEKIFSDDFVLDEYQVALINAKMQLSYWEQRMNIALAVKTYAENIEAGKISTTDVISQWEKAKSDYEYSIIEYENELNKLNEIGMEIHDKKGILDEYSRKIKETETILAGLNQDYLKFIYTYSTENKELVDTEMNLLYTELLDRYRIMMDSGNDAFYFKELELVSKLESMERNYSIDVLVEVLLHGDGDEIKSLATLQEEADNIFLLDGNEIFPDNSAELGLRFDDPYRELIDQLILERNIKIKTIQDNLNDEDSAIDSEIEEIMLYYNNIIGELCEVSKKQAETAVTIRIMEIKLLDGTMNSSGEWYCAAWNTGIPESDTLLIGGDKLGDYLYNDYVKKYEALLEKRLLTEIEALSCLINENESADEQDNILIDFYLFNEEMASKGIAALNLLADRIGSDLPYVSGDDELNEIIAWFLSGGSFFSISGMYITDELGDFMLAEGLYNAYQGFGNVSEFIRQEKINELPAKARDFFEGYGIDTNNLLLPKITDVADILCSRQDNVIKSTALFLRGFDLIFQADGWLYEELYEWKIGLIEYISVYAAANNIVIETGFGYFEEEILLLEEKHNEYEEMSASAAANDLGTVQNLNALYDELMYYEAYIYNGYLVNIIFENTENHVNNTDKSNWRQYLNISGMSDFGYVLFSENHTGNVLLDVKEKAEYFDNRINNAIVIYLQNDGINEDDDLLLTTMEYIIEAEKNIMLISGIEEMKNAIVDLGLYYDYTIISNEMMEKEIQNKKAQIALVEEQSLLQKNEYLEMSKMLSEIGYKYDSQYTNVKTAYNLINEERYNFEKIDEIKRWVSTAGLDMEYNGIEYYAEKFEKAGAVLTLLSGLYGEEEKVRPYDNTDYNIAYNEYEKKYHELLQVSHALNLVDTDYLTAVEIRDNLFIEYKTAVDSLGNKFHYTSEYISSDEKKEWHLKDIITVVNGKLAFSTDAAYKLYGIDAEKATTLEAYFNNCITGEDGYNYVTEFQNEVAELGMRMNLYFSDQNKMTQWGMARDYLTRMMINANSEIDYLGGLTIRSNELKNEGSLGKLYYKDDLFVKKDTLSNLIKNRQSSFHTKQKNAWDNLSASEKADLEFYIILEMNSSRGNASGFFLFTALEELDYAYKRAKENYEYAKSRTKNWWTFGFLFYDMKDTNKLAMDRTSRTLTSVKGNIEKWENAIKSITGNIVLSHNEYVNACIALEDIKGNNGNTNEISWSEIAGVITAIDRDKKIDLAVIENLWNEMKLDNDKIFLNTFDAISFLAFWTREKAAESKNVLGVQWMNDNYERTAAEAAYNKILMEFMDEKTDAAAVATAMEDAFGPDTSAWKNYYQKNGQYLLDTIFEYLRYGTDDFEDFLFFKNEYNELIEKSVSTGLMADLSVREIEWDMQRMDIAEKLSSWRETATLLLEKGRDDWKNGIQRMRESYRSWAENFQAEYDRVNSLWTDAYLSGLEDKELWLAIAADAANNAMNSEMLGIIGSEAERFSRAMDTRIVSGKLSPDARIEAENVLANILNSSGIVGIGESFNAIGSFGILGSTPVRNGVIGSGYWDANTAKINAIIISHEVNKVIADSESKKLAVNARKTVDEMLVKLTNNVNEANQSFRSGMDTFFERQGQWKKSGQMYTKDIVKGSTAFNSVIYETAKVPQYIDFYLEPVSLHTKLDDESFSGLDAYAIQNLVQMVFTEIEEIYMEIFGDGTTTEIDKPVAEMKQKTLKTIAKDLVNNMMINFIDTPKAAVDLEMRSMSSGKFGAYIGYEPAIKDASKTSRKEMFYDQGAGELGRLMTDFIYWACIDSRGIAETGLPVWDKRLWDDSDSIFTAPSIRSITDFAIQVGVGIISAAGVLATAGMGTFGIIALNASINSADDLIFGTLDAVSGYKGWDEAAFNFAKAFTMNTVNSFGSAVFTGVGGIKNGFFADGLNGIIANKAGESIIAQTTAKMIGTTLQTTTTGIVNSAISGITYDRDNKFGYSTDAFNAGMVGMVKSVFSSTATHIATGLLSGINSGNKMKKIEAYSLVNKKRNQIMNNMLGSLAGEGVSYALGGDFTLNLLNTSLFEAGNIGLLELHIRQDGSTGMNIGMGGVNVSPDTIYDSAIASLLWGADLTTDLFMAINKINLKYTFQTTFNFGESTQVRQGVRILLGIDKLVVEENKEYDAVTDVIDGKRTVTLGKYRDGMSTEDQMRLAVVLGHEAYRDGYGSGELNKDGDIVTDAMQKKEHEEASIAHIDMADRIYNDYSWFYLLNLDLLYESMILNEARSTGNMDLFDLHLYSGYNNEDDYFFRSTSTGGDFQNEDRYRNIALLAGYSQEEIPEVNRLRVEYKAAKIMQEYAEKEGYTGDMAEFVSSDGMTAEIVREKLYSDEKYQKLHNFELYTFESLANYGCYLFSVMYAIKAITGISYDMEKFNKWAKENGYFEGKDSTRNNLSPDRMAQILNVLAAGFFDIKKVHSGPVDSAKLIELNASNDMYIGHLRVKDPNNPDGVVHSVTIDRIDFEYYTDEFLEKKVKVRGIYVANPLNNTERFNGKLYYTLDEIVRMDIFKVTPTLAHDSYLSYIGTKIRFPDYGLKK